MQKFLYLEYLIEENDETECDTFGITCGFIYPAGVLSFMCNFSWSEGRPLTEQTTKIKFLGVFYSKCCWEIPTWQILE
jgi:hypothetical protein